MSTATTVTKDDIEEIVGRVVGEIVDDALHLISQRFDSQDAKINGLQADVCELQQATNRIENKFNATIDQVDEHEAKIRKLQTKFA